MFKNNKELLQLSCIKPNNLIEIWAKNFNTHFSREGIKMAYSYIKKMFSLTNSQRMQHKNHKERYDFTPVGMVIVIIIFMF